MTTEAPPRIVEPGIDLVDGVCVEKDLGVLSDAVATRLVIELGYFVTGTTWANSSPRAAGISIPLSMLDA